MKIKEAAQVCGLTEKAIRLYESKGLITPITEEKNGRTFREYSEENIRTLTTIGLLRRAGFSLEQIGIMQSTPERIPEVFAGYREEVSENAARLSALSRAMSGMELEAGLDLHSFAARLARQLSPEEIPAVLPGEVSALPDEPAEIAPSQEELPRRSAWIIWDEEIHLDEKEEAFRRFMEKYERRERIKDALLYLPRKLWALWQRIPRKIKKTVAIVSLALLMLYSVLNSMEKVEAFSRTVPAVLYDRGQADPDQATRPVSVTLEGEVHSFLWREDYFVGTIDVEGFIQYERQYVGHTTKGFEGFQDVPSDARLKIFYEREHVIGMQVNEEDPVYRTRFESPEGYTLDRYIYQLTGLEGEGGFSLIWACARPDKGYWNSGEDLYLVYPAITRDDAEFQVRKYWEQYSERLSIEDPIT